MCVYSNTKNTQIGVLHLRIQIIKDITHSNVIHIKNFLVPLDLYLFTICLIVKL